jgi:hypothetical protein
MSTRTTPREVSESSKRCVVETEELFSLDSYIYSYLGSFWSNFQQLGSFSSNFH